MNDPLNALTASGLMLLSVRTSVPFEDRRLFRQNDGVAPKPVPLENVLFEVQPENARILCMTKGACVHNRQCIDHAGQPAVAVAVHHQSIPLRGKNLPGKAPEGKAVTALTPKPGAPPGTLAEAPAPADGG